jgi:hypothetical protein
MDIPSYSEHFSLDTNNLPFPRQNSVLRNRFNNWLHSGYEHIPDTVIDIPDSGIAETSFSAPSAVSASTPLLPVATAAAPLFGGATSALGTGGTITTGVLGGATLGASAYVVKKLIDRTNDKGLVLPNSEYIGPGNPVNVGAAKNPAEQTAKEHDINYTNLIQYAKTHQLTQQEFTDKVHHLDQSAINSFENDWKSTGNWNAFIAKYGLTFKTAVERVYGKAIYPGKYMFYTFILLNKPKLIV